jgi:hypothetical protein
LLEIRGQAYPGRDEALSRQQLLVLWCILTGTYPNRNVGCIPRTMVRTAHPTKSMVISITKNAALHLQAERRDTPLNVLTSDHTNSVESRESCCSTGSALMHHVFNPCRIKHVSTQAEGRSTFSAGAAVCTSVKISR